MSASSPSNQTSSFQVIPKILTVASAAGTSSVPKTWSHTGQLTWARTPAFVPIVGSHFSKRPHWPFICVFTRGRSRTPAHSVGNASRIVEAWKSIWGLILERNPIRAYSAPPASTTSATCADTWSHTALLRSDLRKKVFLNVILELLSYGISYTDVQNKAQTSIICLGCWPLLILAKQR